MIMKKIPEKYLDLLKQFISFKSISTDKESKNDINNCVSWLENILQVSGFKVRVLKGKISNPIIYAEYIKDKRSKTVLVYGHYDVQPAQEGDGWDHDPFELTIKDERLWARGVIDNKGQFLVHLYSILELIERKELKYNIKLLIEGNEETGSSELRGILKDNLNLLKNDLILISDGTISSDHPVIEISLRGNMSGTLTFRTANNNVHSGIYGNTIPNALHELNRFISKIFGNNDKINIPGFKPDLSLKAEADRNSKLEIMRKLNVDKVFFSSSRNFHTRNGLEPAVIVTGIKGGYIDEGHSHIVPSSAEARINFRFPPEKDPKEYLMHFKRFMKMNIPSYVRYNWDIANIVKGVDISLKDKLKIALEETLMDVYHRKVLYKHVGGSLPIITDFKELLNTPILSLPLANEDSNMHGVGENFDILYINKGLEISKMLLATDILEKGLQ